MMCTLIAVGACAGQESSSDYAAPAARLDRARAEITSPLGATVYTLDQRRLSNLPGGENASLGAALSQLPSVSPAPDSQSAGPWQ